MRVSDALVAGGVMLRPAWGSFEATIAGMVRQLVSCGKLPSHLAELAVGQVCEREIMASTAMVDIGVSIPHARLEGVDGIVAALALSPQAVYPAGDGLPIGIVALVLSSPALTGEHLTFLSALSMLLQSAQTRNRLRNASTVDDVLQLIHGEEHPRGFAGGRPGAQLHK